MTSAKAPGLRAKAEGEDLEELAGNLIDNAFKWAKGAVRVAAERKKGVVEIVVEDDGPGIAPDLHERLFESFVTTKQGGMGLGLRICRTLAQSAGGDIAAGVSPEGGARFVVRLPAAEDAGSGLSAPAALPADARPRVEAGG